MGILTFGFKTLVTFFVEEVAWAVVDLFFGSCRTYPSPWYLLLTSWAPRIWSSFVFSIIIRGKLALIKSSVRTLISFSSFTLESWRSLHFLRTESFSLVSFFLSSYKNEIVDMEFRLYTSSSLFFLISKANLVSASWLVTNYLIFFFSSIFCIFRVSNTSNSLLYAI